MTEAVYRDEMTKLVGNAPGKVVVKMEDDF